MEKLVKYFLSGIVTLTQNVAFLFWCPLGGMASMARDAGSSVMGTECTVDLHPLLR